MTTTTIEFTTRTTEYTIAPLGFGVLEVTRVPRQGGDPSNVTVDKVLCTDVTVHPADPEGSVLEARRVVFWNRGCPVLITSGGDSRAYNWLPWGDYPTMARAERQLRTRFL